MSFELLWALLVFVAVTLFTPGPNNAMLMASGLNFGFRRGLPHLWGVALGFAVMVLAVGVGARRGVPGPAGHVRGAEICWSRLSSSRLADRDSRLAGQGKRHWRPVTFLDAAAFNGSAKGW
jgi:hypothetical protein